MNKLAVIDWGIGGLGFYNSWKKHRPDDTIVYLSDSGFAPYGKLTAEEQGERLEQIFHFLKQEHDVTHIMVACNAASAALSDIPPIERMQIKGVIEGTCEYVRENLAEKQFTLIGGTRTIESQVYRKKLADLKISQKIAQPLSALVERGGACSCEAEYAVREIFEGIDQDVVLACTHYVAMTKLISQVFPEVRCHDPIPFLVKLTLEEWSEFERGKDIFLTSGDLCESRNSAKLAFNVEAEFDYVEIM